MFRFAVPRRPLRIVPPLTRRLSSVELRDEGLIASKFTGTPVPLPYIWLRDSCSCSRCVHPSNRQKLHKSSDFPPSIRPSDASIEDEVLKLRWPDEHVSEYTHSFIRQQVAGAEEHNTQGKVQRTPWEVSHLNEKINIYVEYETLRRDKEVLLSTLMRLLDLGIVIVKGVPTAETSNTTCELRTLAGIIGRIRETFYGGLWDVKNIVGSANIAYTNLDLDLHMDLLYHRHPPQYQLLHCLRNRGVTGGKSVFVDALRTAGDMRESAPEQFAVLSRTPVRFHYENAGHHMKMTHTTFELSRFDQSVEHVNYSPPFQAPLPLHTPTEFYEALAEFARRLRDPKVRFERVLEEGDVAVFDNRRVLHARTAFQELPGTAQDGETNRWLKGTYLEADDILDRVRVIRKQYNR